MKLLIVESPNKVEKIKHILGDDWVVLPTVGHIRDLPEHSMGVSAPDFEPEYELSEKGAKVIDRIRQAARQADEIYIASDPDPEGEAIAWHVQEELQLPHYKRVTFDAITPNVIYAALENPRKIDLLKVRAQEARRVADRLIGYLVSPVLRNKTNANLTAGRVQSPACRLVAELERRIQTFEPTNHFGAELAFGGWKASWLTKAHLPKDSEYILEQTLAKSAASCRTLLVKESANKPRKEAPPAAFRTSTMIVASSVALKFGPKKTMDVAQEIFAAGLINYHRSDSLNLTDEAIQSIRQIAAEKGYPLPASPRTWKEKDSAKNGHEAIRPTDMALENAGDTDDQRKLYRLIWQRAFASQLADAEYSVNTMELEGQADDKTFNFKASGSVRVKDGWRVLSISEDDSDDEPADADGTVPVLAVGSTVTADEGKVLAKKTIAPKRYKWSTLVEKLESMGIGRPSTYATIPENIHRRGYILEEGEFIRPTQLGLTLVVGLVTSKFGFMDYGFTRELEGELDEIEAGNKTYLEVVTSVHARLLTELQNVQIAEGPPKHPCPKCKRALRRLKRTESQIKPGESAFFWACSGFRDEAKQCTYAVPDANGKPGVPKPQPILTKFTCKKCGKQLIHRVKKGAKPFDFWACSGYPACKESYENRANKPNYESK